MGRRARCGSRSNARRCRWLCLRPAAGTSGVPDQGRRRRVLPRARPRSACPCARGSSRSTRHRSRSGRSCTSRLRARPCGGRRTRDQGADHRPLVPEHGEGPRVGPPDRHDHGVSLEEGRRRRRPALHSALVRRTLTLVTTLVAVALATGSASTVTAAPRNLDATLARASAPPASIPETRRRSPWSSGRARPSTRRTHDARSFRPRPRSSPCRSQRFECSAPGSLSYRGRRRRVDRVAYGTGTLARRLRRPYARPPRPRPARGSSRPPASSVSRGVCSVTTRISTQRDGLGWKPGYLGIESRPIAALSVAGVRLTGVHGSAIAAARASRTHCSDAGSP